MTVDVDASWAGAGSRWNENFVLVRTWCVANQTAAKIEWLAGIGRGFSLDHGKKLVRVVQVSGRVVQGVVQTDYRFAIDRLTDTHDKVIDILRFVSCRGPVVTVRCICKTAGNSSHGCEHH